MNKEKLFYNIRSISHYLNKWFYERKEYQHLRELLKETPRSNLLNKIIVFNTVKPKRDYIDRELFIGKILALNGAKCIILLDDGILKHWETGHLFEIRSFKTPLNFLLYKNILKKALKTYRDPNLRIVYYSEIIDKDNINIKNWQELKRYALSSTMRYFQTSELNFNDKIVKDYYLLSLKNAVLSRNIAENVLNSFKPDFFVTSHGIYSIWGPAYEYMKVKGIESYIYTRSHSHSKDRQDAYFTLAKAQTLSRCKFWQEFKDTPVTKEMEIKVKELFNLRINHKTKDTELYYEGKINTYKIDKNDGYKYHIAIFPSLIWDGNIQDRHIAFEDIMDWLISTIDFLKNRKDIKIYLKFHPAEVSTFKESAKIQDLIKDYLITNNIQNLVLIPTENKIDPYKFIKSGIDLGICYDGVLALEMPMMKKPVILGGVRGRFSVEGGNFTINNREEYFNYLENLEKVIEDFNKNYESYYTNIVRYSYWYLFENVMKIPTASKKYRVGVNLLQMKKEDLNLNPKLYNLFK